MQDHVSPDEPMRWKYADGSGMSCWYCDRVFNVQFAHLWPSRSVYQNKIKENKHIGDEHKEKRNEFIESRKNGKHKQHSVRPAGIKNLKVKTKEQQRVEMIAPEDEFWKLHDYIRLFGPLSECKKRKHKITKMHGIRGVLVPGADSGGPFKIRRLMASEIEKEEEHDVGSGSEFGVEVVDQKYADLCDEADENYSNACVGMVASVLAQFVQEPTENTPNTAAKGRAKKPTTPSRQREADPELRRRCGFAVESDDELELKAKSPGKAVGKSASSSGSHRPALQVRRVAPAPAGGSSGGKADTPGSAPNSSPGSAEKNSRGRPEASIEDVAKGHMERFSGEEAVQVYFGDVAGAQLRSICRYIAQASSKLVSLKDDREASMTLARKRLMVIESSIKLHQKWLGRKQSRGSAVQAFTNEWHSLMAFCGAEPIVEFKCEYLRDLHVQVICCDATHLARSQFHELMRIGVLSSSYPSSTPDGIKTKQDKYIRQGVSCMVQADGTTNEVAIALGSLMVAFVGVRADIDHKIMDEVDDFWTLLHPMHALTTNSTVSVDHEKLSKVIKGLPNVADPDVEDSLCSLLVTFPRHGKAIIQAAQGAASSNKISQ